MLNEHKGEKNTILDSWIKEHNYIVHIIDSNYNNSNYRYLMPSVDPCNDEIEGGNNTLRETISKPQSCSVSWAFAITNSIEYAIK